MSGSAPHATTEHATIARGFQALSDEKRLRILEVLASGERCVCELTAELEVGQSLLSFHLKTLKEAGLVVDRRRGRWVHYSLVPGALEGLQETLGLLREAAAAGSAGPGGCCE